MSDGAEPLPPVFVLLGVSFGVMYLNTYALDHVYFSLTRFYMTVLMIAAMALIMLLFMQKMYTHKCRNALIVTGSISVCIAALRMVRSQTFVAGSISVAQERGTGAALASA